KKSKIPVFNMGYLIDSYTNSPRFDSLSGPSKKAYRVYLERIRAEFGDMPFPAITDHRSRRVIAQWHADMATTPRAANYALTTLQTLLGWAQDQGFIKEHHAGGLQKFKINSRAGITWSDDQIARIDLMPPQIAHACHLALWTGQRQGDLLSMTWANVHDDHIMLTQNKGKVRVFVYLTPSLQAVLDALPRYPVSSYLLNGTRGYAWRSGFRGAQQKGFKQAGIEGVRFHDLRGTFENRLWESGCTEAEAYSITGRPMKGSASSYYRRSKELSRAAMLKLEAHFGGQHSNLVVMKNGT
nr:tyrosine-type recombinase/integrase [Methyloceanibacter sp.]